MFTKNRDYDKANQIAEKLKNTHKDQPAGWVLAGDIFVVKQNYSNAEKSYQTALSKNGNNQVVFKLVKVYTEQKQPQKAEQVLTDWLAKNQTDLAAHIVLGQFYQTSKDSEKSIEIYKAALKLAPDNLVILNNLAWELAEKEDADAVKYAAKAYDLAPDNASIADTYGWALVKNNEFSRGLLLLQEAVLKAPHITQIRYHLAYAMVKNGQTKEAKIELEQLLGKVKDEGELKEINALLTKL